MKTYHIDMHQALILDNMQTVAISTGPPPAANALQSCSAVILVNTKLGRGGMYHYPAGKFAGNAIASAMLEDLFKRIIPDQGAVIHGGTALVMAAGDLPARILRQSSDGDDEIRVYLEEKLGVKQVFHDDTRTGYVAAWIESSELSLTYSNDKQEHVLLGDTAPGSLAYGTLIGKSNSVRNLVY